MNRQWVWSLSAGALVALVAQTGLAQPGGRFVPRPSTTPSTPEASPPSSTVPGLAPRGATPPSTTLPGSSSAPGGAAPTDPLAPPNVPGSSLSPAARDPLRPGDAPANPLAPDGRFPPPTNPPSSDPLAPRSPLPGAMPDADLSPRLPGGAFPDTLPGGGLPEDRLPPAPPPADELPPPPAAAPDQRRLQKAVYRNELATFILALENGSGHYLLETGASKPICIDCGPSAMFVPHIAGLQYKPTNDANYVHYLADDGDPNTSEWAFGRRPSIDGLYAVYRQTRGGWFRYGSFSREAVR